MTNYFVRKTGSDGAAGTSAGTAWQTIGKALLAGSPVVGGDTVYIGAGTYRESVTVAITPTSAVNLIGDVDGANTGDAGEVRWTAYTTDDVTAPAAGYACNTNAKNFLSFSKIVFVGGDGYAALGDNAGNSHHITLADCAFFGASITSPPKTLVTLAPPADADSGIVIERCLFVNGYDYSIDCELKLSSVADYDANLVIRNCLFIGSECGVFIQHWGTGTFKGGGAKVRNCTFQANNSWGVRVQSTSISTTIPCTVIGCVIYQFKGGVALQAATSGQITEDYNHLLSATARTNVSAGTHSIATNARAAMLHYGQESFYGAQLRPPGTPMAGSPYLGFGDDGSGPSVDLLNRPKPAGGSSTSKAIGALERHDTAVRETSTVDAGASGLRLTGPGDQDLLVPVDAVATILGVRGRYDTNHGTTNKPQLQLLANGEIGVVAQTVTMTAAVDTWETLTLSSITPTAKGVVTLRLVSRAAAGNGNAYFDTVAQV